MAGKEAGVADVKSIHFAPVPPMHGKLTMRFTDVTAIDFRPSMLAAIADEEMAEATAALSRMEARKSEDVEAWARDLAPWVMNGWQA